MPTRINRSVVSPLSREILDRWTEVPVFTQHANSRRPSLKDQNLMDQFISFARAEVDAGLSWERALMTRRSVFDLASVPAAQEAIGKW